jgi:hypothetical protein
MWVFGCFIANNPKTEATLIIESIVNVNMMNTEKKRRRGAYVWIFDEEVEEGLKF